MTTCLLQHVLKRKFWYSTHGFVYIRQLFICAFEYFLKYFNWTFIYCCLIFIAGTVVFIFIWKQEKTEAVLEGHLSRVTCAEFCPHYSSTLVTAGDDRTFKAWIRFTSFWKYYFNSRPVHTLMLYIYVGFFAKVWNISDATVVYQSAIVSSSPFLCIAMNQLHESFAIGSADGQVEPIVPFTLYFSIYFFKNVTSITSHLRLQSTCMYVRVCLL